MVPYSCLETVCIELAPTKKKKKKSALSIFHFRSVVDIGVGIDLSQFGTSFASSPTASEIRNGKHRQQTEAAGSSSPSTSLHSHSPDWSFVPCHHHLLLHQAPRSILNFLQHLRGCGA